MTTKAMGKITTVHIYIDQYCGGQGLHNNESGHQKYQMKRSIRRVVTAGLVYREAFHVWELHSAELVCLCIPRRSIHLLIFVVLVHENKPVVKYKKKILVKLHATNLFQSIFLFFALVTIEAWNF